MSTRSLGILRVFLVWLLCGASLVAGPATTNGTAPRNLGIEGQVSLLLPRPDYRPRPLDDRTEVILRIESMLPVTNGLHRYYFCYLGLEPGSYCLADYLVRPDGSRPEELAGIHLPVRAMLPEDHDGQLTAYVLRPFPRIGGYRACLVVMGTAWAAGLAAFVLSYRKRRVVAAPVGVVSEPSLAERLRPLVEAAAMGALSTDGRAQLERLLMGYWREKLQLPELRMTEALARLKEHADAGALLRALERWLHQRTGASPEEVQSLLEPYRHLPAPAAEGGKS
jgi:hypothetical protein